MTMQLTHNRVALRCLHRSRARPRRGGAPMSQAYGGGIGKQVAEGPGLTPRGEAVDEKEVVDAEEKLDRMY